MVNRSAGQWVSRRADQHKCVLPALDSSVSVGDLWRCSGCAMTYVVRDDQRDGNYLQQATSDDLAARGLEASA